MYSLALSRYWCGRKRVASHFTPITTLPIYVFAWVASRWRARKRRSQLLVHRALAAWLVSRLAYAKNRIANQSLLLLLNTLPSHEVRNYRLPAFSIILCLCSEAMIEIPRLGEHSISLFTKLSAEWQIMRCYRHFSLTLGKIAGCWQYINFDNIECEGHANKCFSISSR